MARPSLEWDRAGWNITYEDLARIKSWEANVVRFSLNQVFWLDPMKGPLYKRYVDRAVKWSLALGMDVILDLHWTGSGTDYGQKNMPTRQGIDFWRDVANTYKNDGRIMFELYNEPFGVSPQVWKSGDGSWAGMQEMYNVIRNAPVSANNLILVGGLDYAYRLDQVLPAQALSPAVNVAYVTHPYAFKAPDAAAWASAFGTLAQTYPVFATEFGQANINEPGGSGSCSSSFYTNLIDYFENSARNISWTAWAWHVERHITDANATCGFPQVITNYGGTTNPAGTVVKQKMAANP
jgi:endoglucanase